MLDIHDKGNRLFGLVEADDPALLHLALFAAAQGQGHRQDN